MWLPVTERSRALCIPNWIASRRSSMTILSINRSVSTACAEKRGDGQENNFRMMRPNIQSAAIAILCVSLLLPRHNYAADAHNANLEKGSVTDVGVLRLHYWTIRKLIEGGARDVRQPLDNASTEAKKAGELVDLVAPRDGLLGAARLAPSGSPCGRSPSPLRGAVVEPACFLSAVRIDAVKRPIRGCVIQIFENWLPGTDSNRRPTD